MSVPGSRNPEARRIAMRCPQGDSPMSIHPGPRGVKGLSTRTADPDPAPVFLPFASGPHDLVGDPRLSGNDVRVALCLPFWARDRVLCWASNIEIGRRAQLKSRAVASCLETLERCGYVRRVFPDLERIR